MRRECEPVAKKRAGSGFAKDCRGNVAILFGIVCVPVMVLMGLAVDTARALLAAETAQNALDASALAAAQALTRGGLDDSEVARVANENFLANAAGKVSFASFGPVQVESNRETGAVTVSVDTVVETTLGALAHVEEISMRRSATAVMGAGDIEVGLMLDVTGSMEGHKLQALKNAAKDFVDMVVPEGPYANRVRIALAPYSTQVNMGSYASSVSEDGSDCVVEREKGHQNDDAAPGRNNFFHVLTSDEIQQFKNVRDDEPPACPDAEILPLTSDKKLLKETIDDYWADGFTAGHLGIQWAWNLISPNWSGIWPTESSPKPYGAPNLSKVVVLMTDGEFNSAFTGSITRRAMTRESYSHASELCRSMEEKGIVIFSIAFELDNRDARDALADCATPDGEFHEAKSEEELRKVYRNIAIKISQLRITE